MSAMRCQPSARSSKYSMACSLPKNRLMCRGDWPVPFQSLAHVTAFFGSPLFAEYFEERADGWHLIADIEDLYAIASEWGERDYWDFVDAIRCPMLVIEAGKGGMREGQMREVAKRAKGTYLLVPEAGHVVHDDAPEVYRGAVEAFLTSVSISPV